MEVQATSSVDEVQNNMSLIFLVVNERVYVKLCLWLGLGSRRQSGGKLAEAIWPNSESGGNLADSNLAVRVQSGPSSNLAVRWAIPNLADFPIWRYSQSGGTLIWRD